MKQDNYAKFIGDTFIDTSKVLILGALVYMASKDYVKNNILPIEKDALNQRTYFMASRGSQEISDIIDSEFKNSSKPRMPRA